MLSRSSPASSMQKTYDDCYLICSTAVYFEKQNNEEEALRSWRSALDSIYYHNAYRIPANYKPKSETERALQESLRDMELQCKERVDLLDALKKSRDESDQSESASSQAHGVASPANPANLASATSSTTALGHGTLAPVNYPDIGRPPLPQRPAVQVRQSTASSNSGAAAAGPASEASRSKSSSSVLSPASKTPSPALEVPVQKQSRTPSPDKKPGLLRSTLRSHGAAPNRNGAPGRLTAASLRPKPPAPASKAATLAWPGASSPAQSMNTAQYPQSAGVVKDPRQDKSSADAVPGKSTAADRLHSARPALAKFRPKKTRISNGPGMPSYDDPATPSHSRTPPVPPPHREPVSRKSSQDQISQANGLQSPLPPADFPVYRREYSATGAPAVDPKAAQRMAANLHGNLSSYRQASTTLSIPPQNPVESTDNLQQRKKAPPPVPRKAVGSPRKLHSDHSRTVSDATVESSASHEKSFSDDVATEVIGTANEAELATNDAIIGDAEGADWDARVKHLMKNLPKGVDEQAAKAIFNEVVIKGDEVHWDDVAGLDVAKSALKEAVVYPFLRPDLFRGLREPARGMLLFGPPGTGKTMLARAVATESKSTFFAISASSLTSKYLGESEKLVRALFEIAKVLTPSIIFVDEIDSLLSARSGSGEHEATRRIKTEFLIQWSDLAKAAAGREDKDKSAGDASRVLVLAATNLPWAIDEAARRRFVRRQYIPLPEAEVRESQLQRLLSAQKTSLDKRDLIALVMLTDGYSGSDITALAKDAAMGPLRSLGEKLLHMSPEDIRPISMDDFEASLVNIRPSVSREGLQEYEDWARQFGERGG